VEPEPTILEPVLDRATADARRQQLGSGDQSALGRRDSRDLALIAPFDLGGNPNAVQR
jgi:hypothetical protein